MPSAVASEVTCQREPIAALWDELPALLAAHYGEVGGDLGDLDRDMYVLLESVDKLRCYTARDGGELVGYASFVVGNHLHHRGSKRAHHDALYLRPSHRGLLALQLLRCAERDLAADGVEHVYQACFADSHVGVIFERLGYVRAETVYTKRL